MKHIIIFFIILILTSSIFSQNELVTIAYENGLVGGTQNGKWLDAEEVKKMYKNPTKFIGFNSLKYKKTDTIYGTIGETNGCGTYPIHFAKQPVKKDTSDYNFYYNLGIKPILAISSNAKWNPIPRVPKKINAKTKTFKKVVRGILKSKRLKTNKIYLKKAFQVDIDGDGIDEQFLEATSYKGKYVGDAKKGSYFSFVLMRTFENGKPKNVLIQSEFLKEEQEDKTRFHLVGIADLNGNGKMEIIIYNYYSYPGTTTEVFEIKNNKAKSVLFIECGD